MVFVLVGDAARMPNPDSSLRIPPLKNPEEPSSGRYDSLINKHGDHVIIYENYRQYPAFLITYQV